MQNGYDNNLASTTTNNTQTNQTTVIQTDVGAKDGQNKCPKCGATLRPHRACTKCGFYKGEEVIKIDNEEAE